MCHRLRRPRIPRIEIVGFVGKFTFCTINAYIRYTKRLEISRYRMRVHEVGENVRACIVAL